MSKRYKHGKRGTGRFVQLPEWLQASAAWADLKPGARALYIELKRRYNGSNNGAIILSHRAAAALINVHRNTVGQYFDALIDHGFIRMTQGPYLGPSGIGQSALWALEEEATADGKPAGKAFMRWRPPEKPRTKNGTARHKKRDGRGEDRTKSPPSVLKIVT